MRDLICTIFLLLLPMVNAQLVSMQFSVKNVNGKPIESATITLETAEKRILPFARKKMKVLKCRVDEAGFASERFDCWDGKVIVSVTAPGYYSKVLQTLSFKTNYDIKEKETVFLEDEKIVNICLQEKVNPVPLYSYRGMNRVWAFGKMESVAGYDLKKGDWVRPRGRGEVADFFIHHKMISTNDVYCCVASMTFAPGGGAYILASPSQEVGPLVYRADTNSVFRTEFCVSQTWDSLGSRMLSGAKLLSDTEALVIRSRVKLDAQGNVVEANYSKIYGAFSIAGVFEFKEIVFNPQINDTNLELDIGRNLSGERSGEFYP